MQVSSIAEQLFFTTVRVETMNKAGVMGIGTSFVFQYEHNEEKYLFLVTNKHVVKDAEKGKLLFTKASDGNPLLGIPYSLEINGFSQLWYGHVNEKIDIAITPLMPLIRLIQERGSSIFFRAIPNNLVPADAMIADLDALEEIVFIGYPNGIWDTKNLLPIIRKGITATPIAVDFRGESQFLIDASVFPGSSGSPVFLYNPGIYHQKSGGTVVGTRLLLLGILGSVFFQEDVSLVEWLPLPTSHTLAAVSRQMIDLGVVFKSAAIVEAITAFLEKHAGAEKAPREP